MEKANKLKQLKIVESSNIHDLVSTLACDKSKASCMYNLCKECENKKVPTTEFNSRNEENVSWAKWQSVTEDRERAKGGEIKTFSVKVTKKMTVTGSLGDLEKQFQDEMKEFKKHCFNIRQQNSAYKTCIANLNQSEIVIHIDFSENYSCKLSEEVQSYHFGASREQASLRQGVLYFYKENPVSMCSISDSTDHDPAAIWAHLRPVLLCEGICPNRGNSALFSDGSFTQYCQKGNFYLFSTELFQMGFKLGTWSVFEASHGKGAADGVGAAIKRMADSIVTHGQDIPNAATLFELVSQESTVKLFYVTKEVAKQRQKIPDKLTPIPGTAKIHQISTYETGKVFHREVSCYCSKNDWRKRVPCSCHFAFKTQAKPQFYEDPNQSGALSL